MARRDSADLLLLKCPSRFDGVEVWGVRRQVDHSDSSRCRSKYDATVVVRGQVVHHHDVARAQLRQELRPKPGDESILVRGSEHGREHDPASETDSAEECEVLAPVHPHPINKFVTSLHPSVASAHREVQPGLVEENQLLYRNATDLPPKDVSLDDDVWTETLQRPSTFFFTT